MVNYNECCKYSKCQGTSFKIIKDCVCAEWSIPPGQSQTIFTSLGHYNIFTSGFISVNNESSSPNFIIVRFFLGGLEIGTPIEVFNDSSVAFSLTKFDQILVESVEGEVLENCEGEICIKVRTPI